MDKTNAELHDIISEYGLTRREAAELMMVTKPTVDRYLSPRKAGRVLNPTYRSMPAHRLQLLVTALRNRKKKQT